MTRIPWFSEDVQQHVVDAVRDRRASLVADVQLLAGTALPDLSNGEQRGRLVERITDLMLATLAGSPVADHPAMREVAGAYGCRPSVRDLFGAVRLTEKCLEAELALDGQVGAASEHWPGVIDALRKGSFELLSTYCECCAARPAAPAEVSDSLVPRQTFDVALTKEIERSLRRGHPLSVILFQVDNLADIRGAHGHGVAELVLERVEVFLARYFRRQDWVARYSPGQVAVLLAETHGHDADALAEAARAAVHQRLVFEGRDGQPVRVTISGCVGDVTMGGGPAGSGLGVSAAQLMEETARSVRRADACGGNRIQRLEVSRASVTVSDAAALLQCGVKKVRALAAAGTLPSRVVDGRMRLDRYAVEAYARRTRGTRKRATDGRTPAPKV